MERVRLLAEIGVALSAERDLGRLLSAIIDNACLVTGADGGTLYLLSEDGRYLHFAIVQNKTLGIRLGEKDEKITWSPVPLYQAEGIENHSHVSAHVALTGEVVNIEDVYEAQGFNFEGTKEFDRHTGYRSRSMLVVPMRNHERDIIGVLQLINAIEPDTGRVIPFDAESQLMGEALASQAAVALSKSRLIEELERLINAFIVAIGQAIDEKSPYTGGHVRRVAELTQALARAVNEEKEGAFAAVHFTDDELEELRIAAWLHDVGKITTPEYVIDKATKLETLFDRIELIRLRMELMKRDRKSPSGDFDQDEMEEDLSFLERLNQGREFVTDEMLARLQRIAQYSYSLAGQKEPLLYPDELENLSIRRGTLNDRERDIVNNHVRVTYKILSSLPFPKKLRNVPFIAGSHHEKLDGTGYPGGLTADKLPLQARILAFADIFEALTARDRPYKKAIPLEESIRIMADMAQRGHIDADLFALFVKKEIYKEYALKELSAQGRGD
ncbi:MAG TPA: HD domain-containing phosphohydrolase [Syntrophales bacterium]|mgnify:CR=1 FL=1|nr:HD domain-containing phosphohydrolase [Syntrophales bacterium]